jgi:hypothetical protein
MSQFAGSYQVSRSTGLCAVTGRVLQPGESCIATLCDREEDDGFDRADYSLDAWQAGHRPARLFSFWRTTVPDPGQKKNILVDDQVLMDVFDRLADEDRPQRIAFRFVIALILMRKKLLRFVGREKNSAGDQPTEWWLLLPRGSEPETPPLRLANPQLSDDDIRELTAQLSEVLQGEF